MMQRRLSPISPLVRRRDSRGRRHLASVPGIKYHDFRVNATTMSNFVVRNVSRIDEFDLDVLHLQHLKTGTPYYHIHRSDDTNNVFCVAFRTPPSNSTGVPHILEHVTLCGSHKYPVKDPFFKMLNRSLSTYMNALTGSDLTMYPFSTENQADFKNLMDVYLDSVFRPRLDELSFKQEGWRLEHEDPRNPSTPIIFKGVVFNEMKGALSDSNSLFLTRLQQHLYASPPSKPPSTYSFVSGGDPLHIPNLTWHDMKAFHAECYHPSNACLITYGNFDVLGHAEMFDRHINGFERKEAVETPRVYEWDAPRKVVEYGPSDPMLDPEKQAKISVSFLANTSTQVYESIVLRVLTSLLMDGAASPMFKELIDSQLGSDYSPSSGYDRTATRTNLSFGLQGLKPCDVHQVEERIMKVFDIVKKDGFDAERVEAVIHQIELSLKHREANFGMMAAQSMSAHWSHGGNAVEALNVNKHITKLKSEIHDLIPTLIDKYFINNKHRLTFIMNADEDYYDKLAIKQSKLLQRKVSTLTEWERKKVFEDGARLIASQEEAEDFSVLPTLTAEQVAATQPKSYTVVDAPLKHGVVCQIRETRTNGVSYVAFARDLSGLDAPLMPYVPLYSTALTSLGTLKSPLPEISERIRRKTGGISASPLSSSSPLTPHETGLWLHMNSSSLNRNIPDMYNLLSEVVLAPDWSQRERLVVALKRMATEYASSVADSGHVLAMSAASGSIHKAGSINDKWDGLSQVALLNELVGGAEYGAVVQKLKAIHEYVMGCGGARAAVVCDGSTRSEHETSINGVLDQLSWRQSICAFRDKDATPPRFVKHHYPFPFPVNYVARSFQAVPYAHPDAAPLAIYSQLATHHFLHQTIREKGGAYGGGARYSPLTCTLSLFSYRDPNSDKTLNAFKQLESWSKGIAGRFQEQELHEAKLGVLQNLDAPVSASEEGMSMFRYGLSDDMRSGRRRMILATTLEEVQRVAETYVVDKAHSDVVIGSADPLDGFTVIPLLNLE
ncbi:hypothetical protein SeMB42_g05694 [Synchytrium endobioticum]|uniref:Presequence protease, mitochondrial n=1 Tax=Synchytrium endobioticum TaxID=286115 RepID=A0A507CPU8_9FUNG|nr:hypothetical protein SeMB42_g05694 [Synchytrium endobioticum]TPX42770.1 hypothetical protein SeLEV6574_g05416 [Synchytrium endobioticum]